MFHPPISTTQGSRSVSMACNPVPTVRALPAHSDQGLCQTTFWTQYGAIPAAVFQTLRIALPRVFLQRNLSQSMLTYLHSQNPLQASEIYLAVTGKETTALKKLNILLIITQCQPQRWGDNPDHSSQPCALMTRTCSVLHS